jgi:hypothetical protein
MADGHGDLVQRWNQRQEGGVLHKVGRVEWPARLPAQASARQAAQFRPELPHVSRAESRSGFRRSDLRRGQQLPDQFALPARAGLREELFQVETNRVVRDAQPVGDLTDGQVT